MRFSVLAAGAAALLGASVSAHQHQHHHHRRHDYYSSSYTTAAAALTSYAPETCGCKTWYSTFYGEETLVAITTKTTKITVTSIVPVIVSTATVYPVSEPVPTPVVTICPTPGTYTFPATTVTLTATTTVCAASSAVVTPGVHTLGGVTTIVKTATTVVCPYATVQTSQGTVTSKILTTTYVCPSAGTYTIGAHTITAASESTCVYPVPTSYAPGTYVHPETTVTVTLTSQVVFCPYTVPTEAPAPSYSTEQAAPTSPAGPSPKIGASGAWSITYSPYTSGGGCKSASEVEIDIADISSKGFFSVRIYSTDCSGLQNVGAACEKHGLKMIIGVFIDDKGIEAAKQQVTDIVSWGKWSMVQLVVIGNEAIFNGHCSAQQLHDFIVSVKATFSSAGYSGPCTTTETLNILQQYGSLLCEAIDVIGCNVYAFFNPGISASNAGQFVKSQYELVKGICPGKEAYILETGWPSAGSCNGAACPGKDEQKQVISDTIAVVGDHSVIFSYDNDLWKQPGQFGVEQNFGCSGLF